jgi:hypothetical protein
MQRAFNVFSPTIIAYAGEKFVWTVSQAELGSSQYVEVSSTDPNWPLTPRSFQVSPGSNNLATVTGAAGTEATFFCNPTAPNPQTIYVAHRCSGSPCNGASVAPGGHIIWVNESADVLIVRPDPAGGGYWPLSSPAYAIPPNSWLTLEVDATSTLNRSYPILVTTASGENPCITLGQPVIIVQSDGGPMPDHPAHHHHKH